MLSSNDELKDLHGEPTVLIVQSPSLEDAEESLSGVTPPKELCQAVHVVWIWQIAISVLRKMAFVRSAVTLVCSPFAVNGCGTHQRQV